ncbi:type II CAAX prenyl endopeptidase Rce1 family protein [Dyadobacter sp. CY356]|uniref:CPBP family glutamic-type intramembrane protease n=1 Tax=Dyadobacter sp. CY356 TaxID=2906442 RepID=UPI001F1F9059|nr:CPBP family glutamic-type intramembrane protease [Dyadobacter sp. CY356]MCF0059707.1 CPBP family glutamic-type intramembrane protease [Dyadobacter sp. CY356]
MKMIISELSILLSEGKVISGKNQFYLRLIEFLRIYLLALLLSFFSGILLFTFFEVFNIEKPVNVFLNSFRQKSWVYQIALACLYAPIVEELQFRLCLKYSKINFAAFSGIWLFYFLKKFMTGYGLFGELNHTSLAVGLSLIFMAMIYSFLHENGDINNRLEKFWRKRYKVIFYLSVIGFGFLHITNFDWRLSTLLLIPVLTLPQTSLGFMLGYVRLKYGFLYAILLHAGFNLSLLCFQI